MLNEKEKEFNIEDLYWLNQCLYIYSLNIIKRNLGLVTTIVAFSFIIRTIASILIVIIKHYDLNKKYITLNLLWLSFLIQFLLLLELVLLLLHVLLL